MHRSLPWIVIILICLLLAFQVFKDHTEKKPLPPESPVEGHIKGFSLPFFDKDNRKRWTLKGREADYFHDHSLSVTDVALTVESTTPITIKALRASFNNQTEEAILEDHVTVHIHDNFTLTTMRMIWLGQKNRFHVPGSVQLTGADVFVAGSEVNGTPTNGQYHLAVHDLTRIRGTILFKKLGGNQGKALPKHGESKLTCKGPVTYDAGKGILTYRDSVHLSNERGTMSCDQLQITINTRKGITDQLLATGNVELMGAEDRFSGKGNALTIDLKLGMISIIGNKDRKPELTLQGRRSEADKITYNANSGVLNVRSFKDLSSSKALNQ